MARKTRLPLFLGVLTGLTGLTFGVVACCSHLPTSEAPEPQSESPPKKTAEQAPPEPAPVSQAKKKATTYADAIRRRQFERAAKLIDEATETERGTLEVKYARAQAALKLGEVESVLRIADELSQAGPLFIKEAEQLRVAAAKESQDVTLLTHFLGSSKGFEDRLLVAEAHAHNSNYQEARKIADNVLVGLQGSKKKKNKLELMVRARLIKAKTYVAEDKNAEAAGQYHWLATDGAAFDEQGDFDEQIDTLDPKRTLNSKERLGRLEVFSDKGWLKQAEAELDALKKLTPTAASGKRTDHLMAWAVYSSRTDYERAAQLFAKAASHGGPDRRKNLYYEAKALARSHRDRDAIAKYEAVEALGGTYADHAAYQAARLKFIDGQWKKAVASFEKYLKKFGRSAQHRTAAKSDLPIARLAAEDFKGAYQELSALLKDEDSQRQRARLMQLQGVAKLGEKKTAEASAIFRRVIEYRPLSLPALLAAARLKEMGEALPPLIAPAKTTQPTTPLSVALPEKVWRLSRVGLDAEAETALRSHEALLRKKHGERSGEALCRTYGKLQSAKRRYQIAQTAASWAVLSQAPGPNTGWQWDCIYPAPYSDIVKEEAERQKLDSAFIYAIMRQESAFRPTVVSPAKAVGLMQIIPPTAEKIAQGLSATYTPDLMRAPAVNISFGAYYLRYLLDMFDGRLELAAASYNAGPHAVTRWLRAGENLPLDIFVARIPYKETRNYVYRVIGNYARYMYRSDAAEVPTIDLKLPTGLKAPEEAY